MYTAAVPFSLEGKRSIADVLSGAETARAIPLILFGRTSLCWRACGLEQRAAEVEAAVHAIGALTGDPDRVTSVEEGHVRVSARAWYIQNVLVYGGIRR